jgi:hypothetical protein
VDITPEAISDLHKLTYLGSTLFSCCRLRSCP